MDLTLLSSLLLLGQVEGEQEIIIPNPIIDLGEMQFVKIHRGVETLSPVSSECCMSRPHLASVAVEKRQQRVIYVTHRLQNGQQSTATQPLRTSDANASCLSTQKQTEASEDQRGCVVFVIDGFVLNGLGIKRTSICNCVRGGSV